MCSCDLLLSLVLKVQDTVNSVSQSKYREEGGQVAQAVPGPDGIFVKVRPGSVSLKKLKILVGWSCSP